ncbi:AAA domain-containing protein [Sutcliffiella horikoshii]|uniref:AAA domain-containing protein n=1 Tax=Sutcliffiella horikoshii TaxID=79883 RepID=A0AA94WNP6_9BACI|nr:AAA family ATPase [Sutcliffiella horikoshii]TYS57326.1 AAA domain-containing protein [Sutcliffiella horikoshii]
MITKFYTSKVLEQIKDNYIVGVLASKSDYLPKLGDDDEPVTYSESMNDVVFYVKALSQEPKEILEVERNKPMSKMYIGFANRSLSNLPIELKYSNDVNKIISFIRESLEGKLLLFKPVLTQQEKNERFYKNIDNVIVEEEDWKEGTTYYAIPRVNLTPEEFERKLLAEETFHLDQYNHAMPAPFYLLCGNYIYGNIKENQWRIDPTSSNTRVLTSPTTIKRVEITEDERIKFTGPERDLLVFIDEEYVNSTIADRLDNSGISLGDIQVNKISLTIEQDNNQTSSLRDIELHLEETNSKPLSEIAFIRDLESKTKENNLVYSREDLINFHTSIKSSALTILSGQSGIGKTRLATIYGEALGLSQDNKRMLIMPISPSYTEPGDILGYLNPSTGLYMPAESGLVEFLLNAQENDTQVHMLIMDEMNLSQIEHYFAPFISLLELEEKERILHLYSKDSVCHNSQKYKHSIHLKNNLVIVGTMNTDETTKDLSDRLLDRSNIVVLEKKSFLDIKKELSNVVKNNNSNSSGVEDAYGEVYMSWRSKNENWNAFDDFELEFFDKIDNEISKVDPLKGFSIRNIIRMGAYLNNLPAKSDEGFYIERDNAIDLFIKQRVLTKIRGPIELYDNLIGTIDLENGVPKGHLYELFDDNAAKKISDFSKTKKELARKARELSVNGYAT